MSSPATVQFTSSSGSGSVYTGGQATSTNSTMLGQWVATPDRAERFRVTGESGAMGHAGTIKAFDTAFSGTRS